MCNAPETLPLLCVTNRHLCQGDFLDQMRTVAAAKPAGILLREKDLDEESYIRLAREVGRICGGAGVPLIVHSHLQAAIQLECRYYHTTLGSLQGMAPDDVQLLAQRFELSTSCHSVEDALLAQRMGCARILAGHVYDTDCKPGVQPRGLRFLQDVCEAVDIPVWAIGGVAPDKLGELAAAGAAGACMMSGFMHL